MGLSHIRLYDLCIFVYCPLRANNSNKSYGMCLNEVTIQDVELALQLLSQFLDKPSPHNVDYLSVFNGSV